MLLKMELIVLGVALVICFFIALVFAIPKSRLHSIQLFESKKNPVTIVVTVIITILCYTIPNYNIVNKLLLLLKE